jgi:hypothetical protein
MDAIGPSPKFHMELIIMYIFNIHFSFLCSIEIKIMGIQIRGSKSQLSAYQKSILVILEGTGMVNIV